MTGRVLIIAGSDPSGGAGIQADIKTVTALGGYASAAVTALTVQNTKGVSKVDAVAPTFIVEQVAAVLEDIGADAIKIGMIGAAASVEALADLLAEKAQDIPIVLDPVLVATSGDALAGDGVADAILRKLTPLAHLITPNLDEAAKLTGMTVASSEERIAAGEALRRAGAEAALVKGGHLKKDIIEDVLVTTEGTKTFSHPFIDTTSTHGTGCTLSSAIATALAKGAGLEEAVGRAIDYVQGAIKAAPGLGQGNGPLGHGYRLLKN